eukprot:985569-Pleurochrysis_carterae.AAC.1
MVIENQKGKARQLRRAWFKESVLKIDSNLTRPLSGCSVIRFFETDGDGATTDGAGDDIAIDGAGNGNATAGAGNVDIIDGTGSS